MPDFIKETKRMREAANAQPQPATPVPSQNSSTSNHAGSQPPKPAAPIAPEKPRPQLNLHPLTLPQVHTDPIPDHLVPDTPVSQPVVERTLANYAPSPKVRER